MQPAIRPYALAALGSLFWLFLLATGVGLIREYGIYERGGVLDTGAVTLLVVPLAMIAGTIALGHHASRKRIPLRVILASSLVAAFACLLCLGVLGRGV